MSGVLLNDQKLIKWCGNALASALSLLRSLHFACSLAFSDLLETMSIRETARHATATSDLIMPMWKASPLFHCRKSPGSDKRLQGSLSVSLSATGKLEYFKLFLIYFLTTDVIIHGLRGHNWLILPAYYELTDRWTLSNFQRFPRGETQYKLLETGSTLVPTD